ncbi:MAG: endonuclease/exonuclease/phosphatase family protein [Paludibacteraceae bacterium]
MKKIILFLLSALAFISCSVQKKVSTGLAELNIMTYNVRYDNPGDGQNNWKYRKERAAKAIQFYEADIIGMQEVLYNQLTDFQNLLKSYDHIGVGRTDGKEKGEYSPIFYNKEKLSLLSSGWFWLSETPEVAGKKGWDAAIERIATWGKFKDNSTGKSIFILNTHFDHIGEIARKESVNLIMQKVNELSQGLPVIVTGDFNASPNSNVIQNIVNSSNPLHLTDSRAVSPVVYGPKWSFHDFGRTPVEKRELIDYIFIKNNVKVLKYGFLAEQEGNEFLSDHAPVLIKVSF